jgi:hypothetical protein
MTTTTNGQTRQTLASQLDRLDAILDGLADALTESVAAAVKEAVGGAVQEAVQAVLAELITNRDLQQRLHEVAQEAAPNDHADNTKGPLARAWQATCDAVRQACRSALAAGVLVGAATAAAFFATRSWVCRAARAAGAWGKGLIRGAGAALGRLLPTFAFCT